jgi:hypothetical protein
MSSAGQIVGGVVGGIVGVAFPVVGFALGASIGMAIGGYIDPPKGPKGRPPSASDLAVQTATYGAPLSDGYGTYGTLGNVFWVEGNTLRAEEHKAEGGKGGGASGPPTYDIFGTFAVGFGEGEIDGYGRIWFGSKLVCDFRSSDVGTIIATTENGGSITLYTGSASQLPDPRIQADMGAANTPAYRGLHYIVVSDWPMADYGNSLVGLQVKAEIARTATFDQYAQRVYIPSGVLPDTNDFPGAGSTEYGYFNPRIESGAFLVDKASEVNGYAYTFGISYEGQLLYQTSGDPVTGAFGYIGSVVAGVVAYNGSVTGEFTVAGASFKAKTADENNTCHGMAVGADGRIYALERLAGAWLFNIYDGRDLNLISSGTSNVLHLGDNNISLPCIPGTSCTFCVEADGIHVWTAEEGGSVANFRSCVISDAGDLVHEHTFSELFLGAFGRYSAIAAINGLCYGVNDGGGFYIFDRNQIINIPTVPLSDIISARCLKTGLLDAGDIDVSEITQEVRGYKVPTIAAVRSSLEPLQAAWPFDVIPHGYQIKFVPRGQSSVATIDSDELGCVAGNESPGVQITSSREMDSQLPREVRVTYLDIGREYDPNTGPGAKRWNTDAVNVESIELAIVMSATEAAQTEEVLLYMRWLERHDVSFVLPPTRADLEPADVITIATPDATYELRLTGINYLPDGRLECAAKFNNAAVYTSSAVAQEGLSTGQVLTFPGASIASLMDIPCIDSDIMDKPGILAAVCGYSTSWPGGTLFRSDDSGQTWNGVQGFLPPGVVMGLATDTIGAGSTHIIDKSSRLNIRFFNDGPSSVSEAVMLSGGNHFAYGSHGRWEIIAAQTCTAEADGTTTLEGGMLRGRFGTEQYMATHAVGDSVVLLDSAAVRFVGLNTTAINLEKQWRAVTNGRSIDTASDSSLAYSGVNLKPLPPCYVNGSKSAAGDWTINWTRRSRTGTEPFSGVSAPLGEASEAYEVEIYDDSNYTTLLRTITGLSSASATYTNAQQVIDFGAVQKYIYVKVYQLSATLGRGYPASSPVGPTHLINLKSLIHFDEGGEEYIPYRKFGLHCDGTNGSTSFTDIHGNAVTANGGVQISTAQYPALTGKTSSAYFDGSNDDLSITDSSDWDFGTGDFSIRFYCRLSSISAGNAFVSNFQNSTTGWAIEYIQSGSTLRFYYAGNSHHQFSWSPSTNTWYLIEISRSGTSLRAFVDGVQVGTTETNSTNIYGSSATLKIGSLEGTADFFNGYISEIEIVKGFAINTANYTPSAIPFVDSALSITDKADNAVTVSGTATVVSDSDAFGGNCLQANQSSGYVSIPPVDLSSQQWTLDLWIKPDALPSVGTWSGIAHYGTSADGVGGFAVSIYSSGLVAAIFEYGTNLNCGVSVSVGERAHVFVMRDGDNFYMGCKGTVSAARNISTTTFVGDKGFRIGYADITSLDAKAIKIDEWHLVTNEARYPLSGTYSVPTTPFPDP